MVNNNVNSFINFFKKSLNLVSVVGFRGIIIWRAPGPYGASPTQPYKCSRNVKVKVKVKTAFVFDFNILTALKGWVGHAPQGRGALHINCRLWQPCALHIIILKLVLTARTPTAPAYPWAPRLSRRGLLSRSPVRRFGCFCCLPTGRRRLC